MKVIIVGGVAGGAGTAARLKRNREDAEIIMLEKGKYISYANCGLPYYVGGIIEDRQDLELQTPESFNARFNVDVRVLSEVIEIEPETKQVTIHDLASDRFYKESYDTLVLSPGARPVRPRISGIEQEHVFTLRTIDDSCVIREFIEQKKPQQAVIIGSGYIGLEMAENLHRQGLKIALIEAQNHVISTLDPEMAAIVHQEIRRNNVELFLSSTVTAIKPNLVELADGREVPADLVLLSVGVRPETDFLKNSGLELGERGEILIDQKMKTNLPDIYALGDAAVTTNYVSGKKTIIPLASPANKQARIVADIICGKNCAYQGTQGTAIARVFNLSVASTGENEASLKQNNIDYRKSYTFSNSNAGYYPDGKTMGIKLLFKTDGLILGAVIVGSKGVDKRMDVLATAIRAQMTVFDLQELELAYAPPFSSAKDPVNMAGYVAANILDGMTKPFYLEDIDNISADDLVLDVRTSREFQAGHLENAVNIPVDELRSRINELDPKQKIYMYCRIGLRGYIAQRILMQKGFDCLNLSGGYALWSVNENDRKAQATEIAQLTHCGLPI